MKRLVDQERNHGALMDPVFSLSTTAMKEKPPLSSQKKPTVCLLRSTRKYDARKSLMWRAAMEAM